MHLYQNHGNYADFRELLPHSAQFFPVTKVTCDVTYLSSQPIYH